MKANKLLVLALVALCCMMGEANAQTKKPKRGVTPRKVVVPITYRVDTDNDGVPDVRDQCPNTPKGKKVNDYGCLIDTDRDGVVDEQDKCPSSANNDGSSMGPAANDGCPWGDKDGDGFLDNADKCPDVAGVARYFGCPAPDYDGDGIADDEDDCKDKKGPRSNRGCPENKDSDGDGLLDQDDACPDKPGPKETKGCPKITNDAEEAILRQASKIQFESGKASLTAVNQKKYYPILDKVADIMNKKSETYMLIEGHTDNVAPKASPFKTNKELSQARAKFVEEYLVNKGIGRNRLKSVGYGEEKPFGQEDSKLTPEDLKEANKTKAQQEQNRRVKMSVASVKIW